MAAFAPAKLSVRCGRPVEGCALRPSGQLRSAAGHEDGVELRWRWLRTRAIVANCSAPGCERAHDYDPANQSARKAAIACAICEREKRPTESATFCSTQCFVAAWPAHRRRHTCLEAKDRPRIDSVGSANSGGAAPKEAERELTIDEPGEAWELVEDNLGEFVPSREDVGRRLRVECYAVRVAGARGGEKLRAKGAALTEPVLSAPRAPAARPWLGESTEAARDVLRVATYNVLAEIYATAHAYPYCERWALDWSYRTKIVVQELLEADADVVCLQEVQRDHFEQALEPAMKHAGYDALYTQKSREAMGAAGKVDGCAVLWKTSKYRLAEQRALSYNEFAYAEAQSARLSERDEHAYLTRLVKDNVAQLLVLEDYAAPGRRPRRLAVANTHLYSHKDFPDTKLWQSLVLAKQLEQWASSRREPTPLVLAGDFNAGPDSSVYELLSTQGVQRGHPDLVPRAAAGYGGAPVQVLPDARQITHRVPLASAYAAIQGAEPEFTNYTRTFRGTLDYIWFDQSTLRCAAVAPVPPVEQLTRAGPALPNPQYPSDHVILVADFLLLA